VASSVLVNLLYLLFQQKAGNIHLSKIDRLWPKRGESRKRRFSRHLETEGGWPGGESSSLRGKKAARKRQAVRVRKRKIRKKQADADFF
jgi:hypothetical protein